MMLAIYRREISSFFTGMTGYIVIFVYLLINSTFMWILPGEWNVLDSGYASLEPLFIISPWVFLFLVPAVTMRMVAEEKRSGTMELLLSRPVREGHIIYGKYLASVTLVLLALLPCIVYYISVSILGDPPANIDRGGTLGASLGLFFLASVYAAIGIFSTTLSSNQVVAFIIAVITGFILFAGFDSFALLPGLKKLDEFIIGLGINEHYKSVSRGVIDLRDIVYFVVSVLIFTEASRLVLSARRWKHGRSNPFHKRPAGKISSYAMMIVILLLMAIFSSFISFRIDLTSDKRHTLSDQTKEILSGLEDDIFFQVYLDGEMPIAFKKLRRSVRAMLDEFRMYSGRKVDYQFINPSGADQEEERNRQQISLINKGLMPVTVFDNDEEGGRSEKRIFPGIILNYNSVELPINFLKNNPSMPAEVNLSNSVEGLEYELIQPIATLISGKINKVAFIEGHGELDEMEVADITLEMAKYFTVDRGSINGQPGILDDYAAIIIAGPTQEFSEEDKLVIDQYIMNGGKVLWLIDEVMVSADSLALGGTVALYRPLNIEDQLFKYGIRINPVLIQSTDCLIIPVSSTIRDSRQIIPVPWIYYPLLQTNANSSLTRNINRLKSEFVNSVDTVGQNPEVNKVILLASSRKSRTVNPPLFIKLDDYKNPPPEEVFTDSYIPVAVLLEGRFNSLYANRLTSFGGGGLKKESTDSKMIVVADGDIIKNEVSMVGNMITPQSLGVDRYSGQTFGNKDFIINCLNYLVDDKELISLRSREFKIRLLNRDKIKENRIFWQLVNTLGPVLLLFIAGTGFMIIRKKKYVQY
ncbi:MAG: gliding motility-associated ABC transporter substrate-binding protein GldG [Bacteroidales bacterium]|nr:gliding motility-associated ABC transporter substrate-binding protein GldG [Bacteroidales bacterium]